MSHLIIGKSNKDFFTGDGYNGNESCGSYATSKNTDSCDTVSLELTVTYQLMEQKNETDEILSAEQLDKIIKVVERDNYLRRLVSIKITTQEADYLNSKKKIEDYVGIKNLKFNWVEPKDVIKLNDNPVLEDLNKLIECVALYILFRRFIDPQREQQLLQKEAKDKNKKLINKMNAMGTEIDDNEEEDDEENDVFIRKINDPTTGVITEKNNINEAISTGKKKEEKEKIKREASHKRAKKIAEEIDTQRKHLIEFLSQIQNNITSVSFSKTSSSNQILHNSPIVKKLLSSISINFVKYYCDSDKSNQNVTKLVEARQYLRDFLAASDSISKLRAF